MDISSNYLLRRQEKVSGKSCKIPMLVREFLTGEKSKRTSGLDSSEKLKVIGAGQENSESSGVAAAPQDKALHQQRASLLEQAGLAEIAEYDLRAVKTE